MTQQPLSTSTAEEWPLDDARLDAANEAEALGVTRFLNETYVVGGYTYTNLTDAIAQGRRMHKKGAAL